MARVSMSSIIKLALFITLEQDTFAKLNVLTSPMPVTDLNMDALPWTLAIGNNCKQLKLRKASNFPNDLRKGRKYC